MAAGDIPKFTDSTHITEAEPADIVAAITSAGTLTMGVNGSTQGAVKLKGATSGDCTIDTPAIAGTATKFTVPNSNGSAGDFLVNIGSGVTGWQTGPAVVAGGDLDSGGGLVIASGDSTLTPTTTGTGVITALGFATGSAGGMVTGNGPLGTPSSGTLTSCTGLPISTGVSGLGTGIATALAVNTGTDGAPVIKGAALGTPTSGVGTNLTALNATELTSGTIPNARLRSGMIAQTQYQRRDYTGDISTASSTPSAVTSGGNALEKTIIPSSSSSLIRIRIIGGNALALGRMVTLLKRNINGGGDTDITPGGMEGVESLKDQFGNQMPHCIEFIDSPATALSTVYKAYYYSADNSTTVYWNYGSGGLVPVTMTLEEIVG